MEATVVMAKCNMSKEIFAIRLQKNENAWVFTWAFKISEKSANNEGYSQTNVSGVLKIDSQYPGCPHCGAESFYQCGHCKKIVCYKGEEKQVTCPHCGTTSGFKTSETFNDIKGGAF